MKSNIKNRTISFISTIAIVASISGYNVNAASKRPINKNTTTTTTITTTTTTTTTNVVDISKIYGLKTGQKLYYNSATNRHYNDSSFTQTPQPVSDIINMALLANKGKNVSLYIPAGEYLLDKPLILQDGVTLSGLTDQTKLIADDSFNRSNDDFIIANASGAGVSINGIYIEYRSFKNPIFSDYSVNTNGIEGVMLKLTNITSATIENSSFVVKNNGVETTMTPVWFRDGFKNVTIHDCYIENTSGTGMAGGCLWFMNNNGKIGDTINVYNNTIIKNSRDECIGIWGYDSTFSNFKIYNNTINYTAGVTDAACDKLISAFSVEDGNSTFKNIDIVNNNINITGKVRKVFSANVMDGTFSNVIFEKNAITDTRGDVTAGTLIAVFEVLSSMRTNESLDATYARGDISINNNSYTNTSVDGRRCFATATNASLKLNGNIVNSNFVYNVIWEEDGNSKIISSGNDYNYTGNGKTNYGFAYIGGTNSNGYFTNDKLDLQGTPTDASNITFSSCLYK